MDTTVIDEAIDKYVHERMKTGKKSAAERLISYAYLKYAGDELAEFLKKVRGLSRYYVDFLTLMENPFKGPELAWLASMIVVGVASCYMMGNEDLRIGPKPNIRATKRKVALNILYNITVLLTYSSPVHTFFAEGYSFKPQAAAEPPYPAQIAHRGLYAG